MPSHAPTRAATAGLLQARGEVPLLGDRRRLERGHAAAPTSTPTQRSPTSCVSAAKPAAVATEAIASAPTTDHGNGSEVSPPALSRTLPECRPVPGGARSATTRPPGASSWREPAQQAHRVAADADVAVGEQRGLPAALARHRVEDVAQDRRARRGRGSARPPRAPRRCRARSRRARRAAAVIRPGPQPTSRVGPVQRSSTAASPSSVPVHASAGTSSRVTSGPAITHGWPRKTSANTASTEASTSDTDPPPELGRSAESAAHTAATASASVDGVDVAQHRAAAPTVEAGGLERRAGRGPGGRRRHRVPRRRRSPRRGSAQRRAPTSRRPRRRPSTASWSPSPSATAVRSASVTCGVSMPICTTGPGRSAARSRCAWRAARRSPSPRCGTTVQPASAAASSVARARRRSRSPVEGEPAVGRRRPCAAQVAACRAARRRRARRRRPCRSRRRAGSSPGRATGALATTRIRARHDSTRAKSRAVRSVPRTEPDTFERVPSARGW